MATVDHLVTKASLDASDYRRGAKKVEQSTDKMKRKIDGTTSSTNKFSKSLSRLAAGGAIAAFAVAIGKASTAGLNFASAIEESQAKSEVVFGRSLPRVREELRRFARDVGRSEHELEGFAATLQDTFVPLGFARDKAADLSLHVTKLATDLASFNNKADADVVRDLQSALVGNYETLKKYGVIINQTTLKQAALSKGITQNINDISQLDKALLILDQVDASTRDAQGDSKRTEDSFANRQKKLGAEFGRLVNEVFAPSLSAASDALNLFAGHLGKAADNLAKKRKDDIKHGRVHLSEVLGTAPGSAENDLPWLELRKEGIEEAIDRRLGKHGLAAKALSPSLKDSNTELQMINKWIDYHKFQVGPYEYGKRYGEGGPGRPQPTFFEGKRVGFQGRGEGGPGRPFPDGTIMHEGSGSRTSKQHPLSTPRTSIPDVSEQITEATPAVEALASAFDDLGDRASSAFAQMYSEGKINFDKLEDIGKDFLKNMLASHIKMAVLNPLSNSILGAFGAPSSAMLPTYKAHGGPISRDKPYIVGERGPEMIVPKESGTVLNHSKLGGMGGQKIVVNAPIQYVGDVDMKIDARLKNVLPSYIGAIIGAQADR